SQEKAFGDLLMDKAGEYWDELNAVNIRETGLSMGKVEQYWPSTAVKPQAIVNNDLDFEVVRMGFQKARSKGVVVPVPVDAWGKLNNHLIGAHHALEITLKWRDLRQAVDNHNLKYQIEQKYGAQTYKTLLDIVNSMSARGLRGQLDAASGVSAALKNWIKAKVALNPRIFLSQLLSTTNYIENVPIAEWTKYFTEGIADFNQTREFMFEHSLYLRMRYEKGFNEDIKRALAAGKKLAASKKINDVLTSLSRMGDIGAVIYGGYPMVKYLTEVKGMSVEDAVKQFEQATIRSQQSGLMSSLDKTQQSRNLAWNFFSAFSNTPRQYARKIADAWISYYNGDIGKAELGRIMAVYALWQPFLYGLLGAAVNDILRGDDDDDERAANYRNAVAENILGTYWNAFPLVKDVGNYTAKWLIEQKRPYRLTSTPVMDDIGRMLRSIKDFEDMTFADYVNVIGTPLELATGAPVKTVERYAVRPFRRK
ncbi:MAG: hypothetical protein LBD99_06600, partial [Candidatus Margulisbacteria bacterium]|nr:hypothetical protein [Candidatus Margulisiibacteriota bacterium]